MFYVDLEYNSLCFYVSKNLIHMFFGVTGKNRIMFLLPALSLTLHPVLNPVPGPTLHQHLVLHKNDGRFGGYGIGGQ
jgi:hypothetical protein